MFALRDVDIKSCSAARGAVKLDGDRTGRSVQTIGKNRGPIEEIRPGDVVWFPPGEKHWHGATPTTAMTHIAIQEKMDGKVVDWMEQVSDEQYRK